MNIARNKQIRIALMMPPQYGEMKDLLASCVAAEEAGADILYSADHFNAQVLTTTMMTEAEPSPTAFGEKNFESTIAQAAMAGVTSRVEIGCIVQSNAYRNPNLMADIARTIDHVSGGRYILGMGAGYLEKDYVDYGYEFGTAKSRMENFARDLPIILSRLDKLNPKPMRKMPVLVAAMGETIGMRLVAKYADIWNVYGLQDKIVHKIDVLRRLCSEIGRDFNEIELSTYYLPDLTPDSDLDAYLKMGITQFTTTTMGPKWDLGKLRELVQWRDNLASS